MNRFTSHIALQAKKKNGCSLHSCIAHTKINTIGMRKYFFVRFTLLEDICQLYLQLYQKISRKTILQSSISG
jgi:DNA-binding Xre family transcriptional regulator